MKKLSALKYLSVLLCISLVLSLCSCANKIFTRDLVVNFIDVGQADSIFIMLPNGENMLIDGGTPDKGDDVVKYIKKRHVNKIDYLIGTHPHADHIGGLSTVINKLDIGKVYLPKVSNNTKEYKDLLKAIKKKNLKVTTAKAGVDILESGKLSIKMLAPVSTGYADLNDYSAVIKLIYDQKSFLFMGDAQFLSESEIKGDLHADVLKVGHHGSSTATSEEFLARVRPTYAVISVGANNSYNHPNDDVVKLLKENCAGVYRTDKDGTIVMKSNGKDLNIKQSK